MRNILALLALLVLVVGGMGWYLNWFSIQSTPGAGGKRQVNIEIDTQKISADLQKETSRIQQALDSNQQGSPASQTKASTARPSL